MLPKRLPGYRSYCWREDRPEDIRTKQTFYRSLGSCCELFPPLNWQSQQPSSGGVRCFPYFFLLGFTKSGTTDLFHCLSKLRNIYGSVFKEPHFWDRFRLGVFETTMCHTKPGMRGQWVAYFPVHCTTINTGISLWKEWPIGWLIKCIKYQCQYQVWDDQTLLLTVQYME